jgi:hypothetical protein
MDRLPSQSTASFNRRLSFVSAPKYYHYKLKQIEIYCPQVDVSVDVWYDEILRGWGRYEENEKLFGRYGVCKREV